MWSLYSVRLWAKKCNLSCPTHTQSTSMMANRWNFAETWLSLTAFCRRRRRNCQACQSSQATWRHRRHEQQASTGGLLEAPTDLPADTHIHRQTHRHTYRQTYRGTQTEVETDHPADTHIQTDTEAHVQTHFQTYIQTHVEAHRYTYRGTLRDIQRHWLTIQRMHKDTYIHTLTISAKVFHSSVAVGTSGTWAIWIATGDQTLYRATRHPGFALHKVPFMLELSHLR